MRSLAPPGWWRRLPPSPSPSKRWIEFRMETAYGRPEARPPADDVVAFLEWCRETRRINRHMN
jgi:hypothetical protein